MIHVFLFPDSELGKEQTPEQLNRYRSIACGSTHESALKSLINEINADNMPDLTMHYLAVRESTDKIESKEKADSKHEYIQTVKHDFFSTDEDGAWEGFASDKYRWNGWSNVLLPRQEAESYVRYYNYGRTEEQARDNKVYFFKWEGDELVLIDEQGEEENRIYPTRINTADGWVDDVYDFHGMVWSPINTHEWTKSSFETQEDIIRWFKALEFKDGINFHPDDPFSEYMQTIGESQEPLYPKDVAEKLQALMDHCFEVCDKNGWEIYHLGLLAHNQVLHYQKADYIGLDMSEVDTSTWLQPSKETSEPEHLPRELVKKISLAAGAIFRAWLSEEQMARVLDENDPVNAHDFCDANMPVHYALLSVLHEPPAYSPDSDEEDYDNKWKRYELQTDLFNAVFEELERTGYAAEENAVCVRPEKGEAMLLHQFVGECFDAHEEGVDKEDVEALINAKAGEKVECGVITVERL